MRILGFRVSGFCEKKGFRGWQWGLGEGVCGVVMERSGSARSGDRDSARRGWSVGARERRGRGAEPNEDDAGREGPRKKARGSSAQEPEAKEIRKKSAANRGDKRGWDEVEEGAATPAQKKMGGATRGPAPSREVEEGAATPALKRTGGATRGRAQSRDEDDGEQQAVSKSTAKKKGKRNVRSEKAFNCVEDVDEEIERLKKPPRELKKADFAGEYGLSNEGDNPHHFRRGTVSGDTVRRLFGKPYGDGGRSGFYWQGCEVQEVVDRVKYLHPILYQHEEEENPNLITIRFAEGIALEYEEGGGRVNWCAFGEETNKRQRSRYKLDRGKLEELRKSIAESTAEEGKKKVDVRGKEWRGIKVEPGWEGKVEQGDAMRVRGRGAPGESRGGLESAMASGVCLQEDAAARAPSGRLAKEAVEERLQDVEGLMQAIFLEQKIKRELKKEATERLDQAIWKSKQSEWGMGQLRKQEEQKTALIQALEEGGGDVFKEKIKMEGIQEQLAEEEKMVAAARKELKAAEAEIQVLTRELESGQLQFDALAAEKFQLKQGRSSLNYTPSPMVYAAGESILPGFGSSNEASLIRITACCLCSFPFPQNDMVVTSCRHLYHPFCASVVFVRSCKCVATGCGEMCHPDWHRSFGWGEPPADLVEKARMLGLAEERRRLMEDRRNQAMAKVPSDGKFKST